MSDILSREEFDFPDTVLDNFDDRNRATIEALASALKATQQSTPGDETVVFVAGADTVEPFKALREKGWI